VPMFVTLSRRSDAVRQMQDVKVQRAGGQLATHDLQCGKVSPESESNVRPGCQR
jgi:hypothetical protein